MRDQVHWEVQVLLPGDVAMVTKRGKAKRGAGKPMGGKIAGNVKNTSICYFVQFWEYSC